MGVDSPPDQTNRARAEVRTPADSAAALRELQQEFRRRGWHRPAVGTVLCQSALVLTMMLVGVALFALSPLWPVKAGGLLLATLGVLGVSTQAHTASHGTYTGRPRIDRFLTYLGYPVLLGMSANFWRQKHIATHHKAPNVAGFDGDIQLMPFFAMTADEAARSGRVARFYYRHVQWFVFLLTIPLIGFNTQARGLLWLGGKLVRPRLWTAAYWTDAAALALHAALWLVIPMMFFDPALVVLAYVVRVAFVGFALFAAFAPAHFPHEATVAALSQRDADFTLRQTATTLNFRTGVLGRLLCAGVEYQIEHHLFPNYSHVYYPEMSVLVREYCVRNGYPYRTLGWGEGIWKSLTVFARPKSVVGELSHAAPGAG